MKKMESIRVKIWKVMAMTIMAFILVIFFLNATLLSSVRNNMVFDELKSRVEEGEDYQEGKFQGEIDENKEEEHLRIAHFLIDRRSGEDVIIFNEFTKILVNSKYEEDIIDRIYEHVIKSRRIREKGFVKTFDANYYFVSDPSENGDFIMVYFTHIGKEHGDFLVYLLALMLLVLISYFPSKFIAKEISKPILELEDYAEEISNRNWEASHPITNTIEIDQLCRSLDRMKNDLRIAEERDRQFLQKTSHDLKTPVMIIKGYAQAMIDGIEVDKSAPPASVILNESNRLERKIQQLLQLNTIGHTLDQNHDHEIIRIDRLLKSLVSRFEVVKPDLKWQMDLTYFELEASAEPILVSFENIFENQIRFAKTYVDIKMTVDHKQVVIDIRNDGEQFNVDDPQILFDPYKKDMEGNFGLGLAIVKRVVEAHGGDIKAMNESNGVLFKIRFDEMSAVEGKNPDNEG